ncbi:MAG: hypothetical protein IH596_07030 [Bacteroidales bacterium]|nr:hypothetical protein [Bacteroidales bacterium]
MKKFLFWSLIGLVVISFANCKHDKVDPSPVPVANSHFWVYGGTEGGYALLLHTTDGGKTWIRQGNAGQFPSKGFIDGDAMDVNTALLLAAPDQMGESYYYLTMDQGISWEKMSFTTKNGKSILDPPQVRGTDSRDQTTWMVGYPNLIQYQRAVVPHWINRDSPDPSHQRSFFIVKMGAGDKVWIGDSLQLWSSTDMGLTWVNHDLFAQFQFSGNWWYNEIATFNQRVVVAAFLTGSYSARALFKSYDDGNTWEVISNREEGECWNKLFIASESEVLLVAKNEPVYSLNSEDTWETYSFENYQNTNLQDLFAVGKEWFVCGSSTAPAVSLLIYYSPDGGTTWEDRSPAIQPDISRFDSTEIQFIPIPGNGP